MDVLLTGFEPFGGETVNPSWDAVSLLATTGPAGFDLATVRLPCVFGASLDVLRDAIDHYRPSVVICVGQAGGRSAITPERVAVNLDDARIPDNAGNQPVDTPVVPGAPTAYFATLPVKACTAAVLSADIPAAVSHTAGTFVCNHVFYGLMHHLADTPTTRAGFVHVPYTPAQALPHQAPSLPLDTIAQALTLITTTALAPPAHTTLLTGTLH
ncbi:pyroglutamyl-peptidase I [Actinosynnema sp. NPDC020468]|uniref:pyroglutamyl-peptidase I n=1 Tax=Actinosynnema sp. NPDC020468 TaxID=3154488 RepID=UPI0033DA68BF